MIAEDYAACPTNPEAQKQGTAPSTPSTMSAGSETCVLVIITHTHVYMDIAPTISRL